MLQAVLWDVDGTLAETERDGHLAAFNRAFAELGLPWRWSETRYGQLLNVAGGVERLLHDMQCRDDAPVTTSERRELAQRIHKVKNSVYASIVASGALPLREGVADLIKDCANQGVPMAIVTTTSRGNVEALLNVNLGRSWPSRFAAIVCAEDAPRKKPDPQAYLLALDRLQLHSRDTVALEDAPAGITAASAAGVPVVVTHSHFFPAAESSAALASGPSLSCICGWQPPTQSRATRIGLAQLARWHAQSSRPQMR
jgi:HAD superfamily hydrolase (TIGR01509 family)